MLTSFRAVTKDGDMIAGYVAEVEYISSEGKLHIKLFGGTELTVTTDRHQADQAISKFFKDAKYTDLTWE
jgi:hypothetical protein